MYSAHNEGKSVVAERFIRTLKNKIYKYMTSVLKKVYIDKLDGIVNKYNNKYHGTIKMKPGLEISALKGNELSFPSFYVCGNDGTGNCFHRFWLVVTIWK